MNLWVKMLYVGCWFIFIYEKAAYMLFCGQKFAIFIGGDRRSILTLEKHYKSHSTRMKEDGKKRKIASDQQTTWSERERDRDKWNKRNEKCDCRVYFLLQLKQSLTVEQ